MDNNPQNTRFAWLVMAAGLIAIAALLCLFLSGCVTERGVDRYHERKEQKMAQKCGVWYPVQVYTNTATKYLPGKTIQIPGENIYIDYNCDSAVRSEMDKFAAGAQKMPSRPTVIRVPVPVYQHVDTLSIERNAMAENTALLRGCQLKYDAAVSELETTKKDRDRYKIDKRYWEVLTWGTWLILLLMFIAWIVIRYYQGKARAAEKILKGL